MLMHYGIKEKSGRYKWGSGDRPYQRLETNILRAVANTKQKDYSNLGPYAKNIHANDIAKNMSIMRDIDRKDVDRVLDCAARASSSYTQLTDTVGIEQKELFKNQEFRDELEKRLFDDLGVGCDDSDYYDMVLFDNAHDLLNDEKYLKYLPETQKAISKFNTAINDYYDTAKNITADIVNEIGDKTVIETKEYSLKYSDVVNRKLLNDTDDGWVSYMARHGVEAAVFDSGVSLSDIKSERFSMEDYNKRHSK